MLRRDGAYVNKKKSGVADPFFRFKRSIEEIFCRRKLRKIKIHGSPDTAKFFKALRRAPPTLAQAKPQLLQSADRPATDPRADRDADSHK
jgi:hypothetical protein